MSTLAYGWVERCSDVTGCGQVLNRKIIASITSPLQFIMNLLNAGMSMFASADCLKDYASLDDELCLLFRF